MKKAIFLIFILGITANSIAQQIPLKGVVTVQNSKTYTGKTQYVKNAEVTHPNAKNDVTDDDGKFTLNVTGLKQNIQTQITVIPCGAYSDYVVVNEKELQNITLGRVTPVGVYICKKGELEQRQAEMVGINMRKLEERMENDKKRLQKELDDLKLKNDYLNVRYGEIKDSLDIISKNTDNAFGRIKEYAKSMVLENLDDKDNNYVKAYECFSRGELDSVSYYLQEQELELKHQKIVQLQEEAQKEKELAEILTESAKAKEEYTENSLSELIQEWLLLARTYDMKHDYEKTMFYYEKAIYVDSSNAKNIFEFADYLFSIREFPKAENYYLQCLEIYRTLEKKNPNNYLSEIANTLNNLANLHGNTNEYFRSLEEYEEALKIRRKLAEENPKAYLVDLSTTLNNMGILHYYINEYQKATEEWEEALKTRRKLADENPKAYLNDVAKTLNNLAILHRTIKEYPKALEGYEEVLKINRTFAAENPKTYLADVARTLNNLAILDYEMKEYPKAVEEMEEALEIYRKLATENPKAYLVHVSMALHNLTGCHKKINEYSKALEDSEEALEIRRTLAAENPKVYLADVARTLNNLALLHQFFEEYSKAIEELEESLEIRRKLAEENPKAYLADVAESLFNLAISHKTIKEYSKALEEFEEALKINRKLAEENPKVYLEDVEETLLYLSQLLEDLEELEKAGLIPEERKDDVEKIRTILKE